MKYVLTLQAILLACIGCASASASQLIDKKAEDPSFWWASQVEAHCKPGIPEMQFVGVENLTKKPVLIVGCVSKNKGEKVLMLLCKVSSLRCDLHHIDEVTPEEFEENMLASFGLEGA